jgi:hypothetical protein
VQWLIETQIGVKTGEKWDWTPFRRMTVPLEEVEPILRQLGSSAVDLVVKTHEAGWTLPRAVSLTIQPLSPHPA